jgi:hypothetical protein
MTRRLPITSPFSLTYFRITCLLIVLVTAWVAETKLVHAETEKRNPWVGLQSHGAPTLAFGGQAYFPIYHNATPGKQRWDFLRDGDSVESPTRRIEIHMEPKQKLRSYEKFMVQKRKPVEHQVHYRSAHRQTHSWIEVTPKGRVLHFVDWQLVSEGIQVSEIIINEQVDSERNQSNLWRRELETIVKHTGELLHL